MDSVGALKGVLGLTEINTWVIQGASQRNPPLFHRQNADEAVIRHDIVSNAPSTMTPMERRWKINL